MQYLGNSTRSFYGLTDIADWKDRIGPHYSQLKPASGSDVAQRMFNVRAKEFYPIGRYVVSIGWKRHFQRLSTVVFILSSVFRHMVPVRERTTAHEWKPCRIWSSSPAAFFASRFPTT